MYEYSCGKCGMHTECIRPVEMRDDPIRCQCGSGTKRIVTMPVMQVWNKNRIFPNVVKTGDGSESFSSREKYNAHLKDTNTIEFSTDAPKKKKLGHKIVDYR